MDDSGDIANDDNLGWFAMGYLLGHDDKTQTPEDEKSKSIAFAFVVLAVIVVLVCVVLHALTGNMPFAVLIGILGFALDVFVCWCLSKA